MENVIGGELVDPQEVHLGLQLGQFGLQLIQLFLGGCIQITEAIAGNLLVQI